MKTNTVKANFEEYLKSGKFRSTPERFQVLDAVLNADGHFDADGLYIQMKSSGSKVSRATVYNTLELLQKCGLISRYRFGENHSRFERTFDKPQHDHLICLQCGGITEFSDERIKKIQQDICKEKKFYFEQSTLQVFGRCARCTKEEKQTI